MKEEKVESYRIHWQQPSRTEDGRPFVLDDPDLELWLPEPPRDGDPVFCRAVHVGVVVGDWRTPGKGRLDLISTEHFPPEIAAKIQAGGEATARANALKAGPQVPK